MNFYVTTELRRPSFGDQYIARDGNDDWLIWDARPELCDGYENGVPVRLPRLVITSIVAADAVTREGRGGESSVAVSADSLCTSAATPAVEREHITNGDPCWCNPTVVDYSEAQSS